MLPGIKRWHISSKISFGPQYEVGYDRIRKLNEYYS